MRVSRLGVMLSLSVVACAAPSSDEENATAANGATAGAAGAQRAAVETTPSGLRFQVIEEGTGAPITSEDAVIIRYRMRIEKGPLLSENETRGEPLVVSANTVIPGMAEGFRRMREGGVYRIWIPPSLGYGETRAPELPIDDDDTLEMRIWILQVERGDAGLLEEHSLANLASNAATD